MVQRGSTPRVMASSKPSKAGLPDSPATQLYCALGAFYILLIVYSSLMPWSGWRWPLGGVLDFVSRPIGEIYRRGMAINFLAYVPLGLLLASSDKNASPLRVFLRAILAGAALSFSMEAWQSYVPSRTPSKVDWISNTAGTLMGAAAVVVPRLETPLRRLLLRLRSEFRPGPVVNAGLGAVVLWVLSEWSPFIPVFQTEHLRSNMMPLLEALRTGKYSWQPFQLATYTLYLAALLLLITVLQNTGGKGLRIWAVLAGCVVLAKPLFYRHTLRLEALGGAAAGILLAFVFLRWRWRAKAAMLMLIAGFAAYRLQGSAWAYTGFNWVPFWMQLQERFDGFATILQTVWPAMGLGCLAVLSSSRVRHRATQGVVGGTLLLLVVFALEWALSRTGHGLGDITTVLLTLAGWSVPWLLAQEQASESRCAPVSPP